MENTNISQTPPQEKSGPGFWKKFWNSFICFYIIAYALLLGGQSIGIPFYLGFLFLGLFKPDYAPFASCCSMYSVFIGIWALTMVWYFCLKENRPLVNTITPKMKGNNILGLISGLVIGGGLNALCIFAAYRHNDIELTYNKPNILYLVIIFILVFIQSSAEELICRSYLFYRLQKRYNKPFLSVFLSSAFFALIHLTNSGVSWLAILNILFSGIMFALMVYYFDSMWAAFAAHAGWNYTQNIIFGLPNSGNPSDYSIFVLNNETAKDSFFYNVEFGVEETFFATILLAAFCLLMFLLRKILHSKEKFDIWNNKTVPNDSL